MTRPDKWKECLSFFGNRCAYCGKPGTNRDKLQKDHVWPRRYGGPDVSFNLIPACQRCNLSKGKKNPVEWYRRQPFYSPVRMAKIMVYMAMNVKLF